MLLLHVYLFFFFKAKPFLHLRPSLTELFPSLWNLALKITFVENLLIEIFLLWFLLKYLKTFICFRTLRCQLISFNILLTLCSSYSWCLPCWFSEIIQSTWYYFISFAFFSCVWNCFLLIFVLLLSYIWIIFYIVYFIHLIWHSLDIFNT